MHTYNDAFALSVSNCHIKHGITMSSFFNVFLLIFKATPARNIMLHFYLLNYRANLTKGIRVYGDFWFLYLQFSDRLCTRGQSVCVAGIPPGCVHVQLYCTRLCLQAASWVEDPPSGHAYEVSHRHCRLQEGWYFNHIRAEECSNVICLLSWCMNAALVSLPSNSVSIHHAYPSEV